MKFRIGKDRLENWQQWEMRVAQAMGTRILIAVLGKEGDAAGTIQALVAKGIRTSGIDAVNFQEISFDNICMLRRENLTPDLTNNVIPYARKIAEQGPTRHSRTSRLRYKAAKALSPFAVATLHLSVSWYC